MTCFNITTTQNIHVRGPLARRSDPRRMRLKGYFSCFSCGHFWISSYSWVGYDQKCKACGSFTFPFIQIEAEATPTQGGRTSHKKSRCGKCAIAGNCTKL